MKLCLIYGEGIQDIDLQNGVNELSTELKKTNQVDLFCLDEMNLKFCVGCWTCWWKEPGRCIHKDDGDKIFESVINSDFIVFISPLRAGFISSSLKKITDRLIVLLHPYIQFVNNESHHHKRYEKYPDFGLIVKKESDTDDEDLKIVKDMYDRFAINFHNKQAFIKTIDDNTIEELITEIETSSSK